MIDHLDHSAIHQSSGSSGSCALALDYLCIYVAIDHWNLLGVICSYVGVDGEVNLGIHEETSLRQNHPGRQLPVELTVVPTGTESGYQCFKEHTIEINCIISIE